MDLIETLFEVNYGGIARKQKSITRLYPPFPDRVKKIGSMGGLRLVDTSATDMKFKVHSGTIKSASSKPQPKKGKKKVKSSRPKASEWYDVIVRFKNVVPTLEKLAADRRLWKIDKSGVNLNKLSKIFADKSDMQIHCSCPNFLYGGFAYVTSQSKYDANAGEKENRPPRKNNPSQLGMHCKHLQNVMNVFHWYTNTLASWLKKYYAADIARIEKKAKEEAAKFKVRGAALGLQQKGPITPDEPKKNESMKESKFDTALASLLGTAIVAGAVVANPNVITSTKIDMKRIATIESSNNPKAINKKTGARGLCQLMKPTWEEITRKMGVNYSWDDALDSAKNLEVATYYFNVEIPRLLKYYKIEDNVINRLVAYNWGIGNLKKIYEKNNKKIYQKLPQETKNYIIKYFDVKESIVEAKSSYFGILVKGDSNYITILGANNTKYLYSGSKPWIVKTLETLEKHKAYGRGWQFIHKHLKLVAKQPYGSKDWIKVEDKLAESI